MTILTVIIAIAIVVSIAYIVARIDIDTIQRKARKKYERERIITILKQR